MPTAKTYSQMPIQGEPFKENGRMYVNVQAKNGIKKVRWYSDAEYKRMYPDAIIQSEFNARQAFGFGSQGYITIFKGDENIIKAWAQAEWPPKAWYNTIFHFYTPGYMILEHLPPEITPIRLYWNEINIDEMHMKSYDEVEKYVLDKIIDMANYTSQFQGEKDHWLEKTVTIRENKTSESKFGEKHTHFMVDTEGNTYIWETSAKSFEPNVEVNLKMKVKDFKEINGEKCTVVWYCKEV